MDINCCYNCAIFVRCLAVILYVSVSCGLWIFYTKCYSYRSWLRKKIEGAEEELGVMSATLLSYCNPSLACNYGRVDLKRMAFGHLRSIGRRNNGYRKLTVFSVTEGSAKSSESEETIPSWAKPDSEEPPPWAREEGKESGTNQGFQVPFYIYLLASSITAIAAVSFPLTGYLFLVFLKVLLLY